MSLRIISISSQKYVYLKPFSIFTDALNNITALTPPLCEAAAFRICWPVVQVGMKFV